MPFDGGTLRLTSDWLTARNISLNVHDGMLDTHGYSASIGGSLVGERYLIVTNAAGTFAGLPQGAHMTTSVGDFEISNTGGDGNDVVLTFVGLGSPDWHM